MSDSTQYKHVNKLRDAHVLVFGGSAGLGLGVAKALVEYGARVVISSSNQARIDGAVSQLQAAYPDNSRDRISGIACDLSKRAELETNLSHLLGEVVSAGGKIDHIVFTAGDTLGVKAWTESTLDEIIDTGNIRFFAPIVLGKLAPKYFNPGPNSSITLTGGTMTQRPAKGLVVNIGFGAGVEGLVRGLAVDLAPIRVNLVIPGAIDTDLLRRFAGEGESRLKLFANLSVLEKIGTIDEAAEAYIYSIRSAFTTGAQILVDGGRMIK